VLKNYLKIAIRNLAKNKVYSALNATGLSIGMAVALLIGLWIWDEVSFDTYHRNYNQLAQVMTVQKQVGSFVVMPLSDELQKYSADFKHVVMASWNIEHVLSVGEHKIAKEGMWVQPVFPEMFSLKMIKGELGALKDPSSVLLAASVAKALFDDKDPMNEVIKLDNATALKVAGVYEDLPSNTSLYNTKFLLPWEKYLVSETWTKEAQTDWRNHCVQIFVQMNGHADFDKVTAKIRAIPMQHINESKNGKEEILLHPMSKWHLRSEFRNGKAAGGRIEFVWLFGIIGVFVLLLACINFMNLSTARSQTRAKEVGIRKAVGCLRQQLIGQFLCESLLLTILAFVLAILLAQLSLPFFNALTNKSIRLPWLSPVFWLLVTGFILFTGLISGSYPAFYLSAFRPVKVLKGMPRVGKLSAIPRKALVVLQFTVSIALIIGTLIVFRQILYAKGRPVGYSREGLIMVFINTPELHKNYETIRARLLETGAIENMAHSSSATTWVGSNNSYFDWNGKDPNSILIFGIVSVTHDFGKTIGWRIKDGRDFSRDFPTDSGAVILNEAAVKQTGLKHPIGEMIRWLGKSHQIIGVAKDMIMESPYAPVKPTFFLLDYDWAEVITLRLKPALAARQALAKIAPVFEEYNAGNPFQYKFIDEEYARKFSDEERISNLATFFAILAIFISCLGLFGLASFIAEQRIKEIGIRKVLGASVLNIWGILSKDFLMLVIISCLVATPIAAYLLEKWLQRYEYRANMPWWVFIVSGAGVLLITILTVSYQAIKAALVNPIKSLRGE